MNLKLTPENQLTRFREDRIRAHEKRGIDFSIGDQIELLIRRVDALERALASCDRNPKGEDREDGLSAKHESAVPNEDSGDAHA